MSVKFRVDLSHQVPFTEESLEEQTRKLFEKMRKQSEVHDQSTEQDS